MHIPSTTDFLTVRIIPRGRSSDFSKCPGDVKPLPIRFWLIAALLVGVFWALAALRHGLLHSTGFDLGIYDQVAWQMSQGLDARSSQLGLHHMGNHGAWMFYAIAPFYRLLPSVQWLFLTQALGLILTAWPLWHLGQQAGLRRRGQWLLCWLWWLQPVVFNVNLFDFHPETWAMPLLVLAIWANRAERRCLWLIALAALMGCRDGLSLIVIGLAVQQLLLQRWRWALEALTLGLGWLLFLAKGLYPALNNGAGPAALERYRHLGDGVGDILHNAVLSPAAFLGALDWSGIFSYLLLLSLPIVIYWRFSSLPLLAATLPLLAANTLSSWESQRSLAYQYSLPLAVLLVVAACPGISALCQSGKPEPREPWPLRRLWAGYIWAALCWALLVNPGHFFDRYLSQINQVQAAQRLSSSIPVDASVATHNHLVPQLSHREAIYNMDYPEPLPVSQLSGLDIVLLNRRNPYPHPQNTSEKMAATVSQLRDRNWRCEDVRDSAFVLCRRPGWGASS